MEGVVKVTTVLNPPYVMQNPSGGYEGFMVDLLDNIASSINIKYDLQLAKDGRYGGLELNGTWNGMIGELVRGEADVAAGALMVTSSRARVVDFTKPFLSETVRLLVKKPSRPELGLGSLLQPFSDEVWLCLLFAALVVSVLFMLIGRFNPHEWRQVPSDKDPRGARHSFGLRDSLMFVFSSMFLQGYRETPRSLAGRTLAVSWFAAVFFTVAAYIGNVGPFLSVEKGITLPFQNIEDLSQQTSIRVGVIKGGSTYNRLKSSNVAVYGRLFANMVGTNSFVETSQEGVEKVRESDGRFVMLTESLYGKYVAGKIPCDIMLHGPGLFQTGLSIAVPIRSGLKDRLDIAILELKENGRLQSLQQKWWNSKQCGDTDIESPPPRQSGRSGMQLGLRNLATSFLIIIIGAIVSVVMMVGEILFKKFRQ